MSVNKVAVFGNTGGGKSALSRRLAAITGLPLYVLDIIQFRGGRYRPEEQGAGSASPEKRTWQADPYGCGFVLVSRSLVVYDL